MYELIKIFNRKTFPNDIRNLLPKNVYIVNIPENSDKLLEKDAGLFYLKNKKIPALIKYLLQNGAISGEKVVIE